MNFYQYLEEIRKRPQMYFGNDYSLSTLYGFIVGFDCALNNVILRDTKYNSFNDFGRWLNGCVSNSSTALNKGWYGIIIERNPNDVEEAFLDFYTFLEVYKTDKLERTSYITKPRKIKHTTFTSNKANEKSKFTEIEYTIERIDNIKFKKSKTIWVEYYEKSKKVYDGVYPDHLEWEKILKQRYDIISIKRNPV